MPEFVAQVPPELAVQGSNQCEKFTKLFVDYAVIRSYWPAIFLSSMLILVMAIIQYGSGYGEYLYLPYGFVLPWSIKTLIGFLCGELVSNQY